MTLFMLKIRLLAKSTFIIIIITFYLLGLWNMRYKVIVNIKKIGTRDFDGYLRFKLVGSEKFRLSVCLYVHKLA